MGAYYNENDKFAAAWLRELIRNGTIEDGEVDERDIRTVCSAELCGFSRCHFFAGIGVWSYALIQAGFPENVSAWTGSCPCQPFSVSGKRRGASDERHLWPAWAKLIRESRPERIFGEQVASDDGLAWLDLVSADLEDAGYSCGAVDTCAAGFGAPQISQRLFFVAEADGGNSGTARIQRSGINGQFAQNGGVVNGLATTATERCKGQTWNGHTGTRRTQRVACKSGELGTATLERNGAFDGQRSASGEPQVAIGRSSISGDVETPASDGRIEGWSESAEREGRFNPKFAGCVNGFWRDAEWLSCRDEKYRPVEPGTFPLAHGAPCRVGRLRGYGNALVAPQAIAFVKAYLEIKGVRA